MYTLRCGPSGLGNVFLDFQQVSDQPHAELQGNSPPGIKIANKHTHTQNKNKQTNKKTLTCMEHRILIVSLRVSLIHLPSHSSQQ